MSRPILQALERDKLGKNFAYKSRTAGYIPAVLYDDMQNKYLNLHHSDMFDIIKKHGDSAVVEVKFGEKSTTAVIKEVQRDPVSKELLHVDLKPINSTKIAAKVPINFVNTDSVIKQKGVIQSQKNTIEIECDVDNVPKAINIDASKCEVGNALKVKDIEVSAEIAILDNPEDIIASIIKSTNSVD